MEIVFRQDMTCCKSTRVASGLTCRRPVQMCCARRHACGIADDKGLRGLDTFARHLLGFWPLSSVFWVFATAGQMSALAEICRERWTQMPDEAARAAYRAEVMAAVNVCRAEAGPYNSAAFVATFDFLCAAASARP